MKTNNKYLRVEKSKFHLVLRTILVFIIAISSMNNFVFLAEMDMDTIELLTKGEKDADLKETGINLEFDKVSFLNLKYKVYVKITSSVKNDQCVVQLSEYSSKISTPPPDFI